MDITERTIFIAGGTSGIGRELARRLASAGSRVVVGGRRAELLAELADEGVGTVEIDVTSDASVLAARDAVLAQQPELDTVVTMSGILTGEDLRDPAHFATAEQIVQTNLLGTIRVLDAFTPHLIARGAGALVTVTSGIAFLPFPAMPTYGATKAGVHAYSEALRAQLAGAGVEVVEIVPPAVDTAGQGAVNPHALELGAYVDEVLQLISAEPTPHEVLVEGVRMHRFAERDGTYSDLLAQRAAASEGLLGR